MTTGIVFVQGSRCARVTLLCQRDDRGFRLGAETG
jgi:hypothetical protein